MPGHRVSLIWQHDPTVYAPAKYRRACRYDAFVPDRLTGLPLSLAAEVAGVVSEAEDAIRGPNDAAQPALAPLARLLLRTESIASSKVEGMQLGVRELARAEARMESGGKAGPTAREVMANIDAMELAVHQAAAVERFTVEEILAIHRRLMAKAPNVHVAGRIRTGQNWIGGNDHNPCGADFVPPPWSLAGARGRGVRHPRVGLVVQPPSPPGATRFIPPVEHEEAYYRRQANQSILAALT